MIVLKIRLCADDSPIYPVVREVMRISHEKQENRYKDNY